jgi:hypothetical protein
MERRLSNRQRTRQSGYALILLVVGLMGIGGVVIASFTQGAKQDTEHQRYLHNQRILREAKQALLQYAYNYPVSHGKGPGRLPCPDVDGNGNPDSVPGCDSAAGIVGRFPWKATELNFYDASDASGEGLWYAVSRNFGNSGSVSINSATQGTISIEDRSGALIHDATGTSGVVAVIIAPGPPIERAGVEQVRTTDKTDPEYLDPVNYLDLFDLDLLNTVDNADFVNGDADGFVTGPIEDMVNGVVYVNDQMIVITAAEVTAMAEKATLQAYRKAINDYLTATGGVYPWLYNYDGVEYDLVGGESNDIAVEKLSSYFPVDTDWSSGTNYHDDNGRIPSIFAEYFTVTDSQPFESFLEGTLTITYDGTLPTTVASDNFGNLVFNDGEHTLNFSILLSDLRFEDLGGTDGRLTATLSAPEIFTWVLYFWDDDDAATGKWTVCLDDGIGIFELGDCHRDSGGNNTGGLNANKEDILRVELRMELPAGEIVFDADYDSGPTITHNAAEVDSHATITGAFDASDIEFDFDPLLPSLPPPLVRPIITATYQYDDHYHKEGESELWSINNFGDLTAADLLGNATLTLGMNYFPVLPDWAFQNGWHNYIKMAYAPDYQPPATGPCTPDITCLHLADSPGAPQDKISLLLIGRGEWLDSDEVLPGNPSSKDGMLEDELRDVFDEGNHNGNTTYYTRRGYNKILVIKEL